MALQRPLGASMLAVAIVLASLHVVSAQQSQVVFCGATEDGATEGCGRATPGLLFLAISPFTFWPFVILWIVSFVFCLKEVDWDDYDCCRRGGRGGGGGGGDDTARFPAPRAEPTPQALPLASNPMGAPTSPPNPNDAVAVPIADGRRGGLTGASESSNSLSDTVGYARGAAAGARRRGRGGRGGAANNRNKRAASAGGAASSSEETDHKTGDDDDDDDHDDEPASSSSTAAAAAPGDNAAAQSRRDSNTLPPIGGARSGSAASSPAASASAAAAAARARAAAALMDAAIATWTPAVDGKGGMWSNGVWACKTCSLHNKPGAVVCSACGSAKVSGLPSISGPAPPIPE